MAEVDRFLTLAGLTARTTLSSRKGAVTWAVALLPLYVVGGLVAAGQEVDASLFQVVVGNLFLQVVLLVVALVHGTRLFREEVEDRTLSYLTTRNLSKGSLVAYKFLGYYGAALAVVALPLAASYGLAVAAGGTGFGDHEVLRALLAMAALGVAGYGGLFLLLGLALQRALTVGLLYGFLWEPLSNVLPGDVPLLSVSHYLRSVGAHVVPFGPLSTYPTGLELHWAVAIPVLVALGAAVLSALLLGVREVPTKE